MLDARRGEVYGAVYDACGAAVVPETVMPFTAWLRTLPEGEIEFVAMDFSPFAPAARRAPASPPRAVTMRRARWPRRWDGSPVSDWRAGQAADPAAIDANYVRRSDAELFWKEY